MVSDGNAGSHVASLAGLALGLLSQNWDEIGLGNDPQVAASDRLDVTVERITALLLIRIIAWIAPRNGQFPDLSSTSICRKILVDGRVAEQVTDELVSNVKEYVHRILAGYQDVPYHNYEHCYHVVMSTNKMIDMMLLQQSQGYQGANTNNNSNNNPAAPYTYGFKDDPLMQLALVFAALVHDVEHQGIPNRQLADEDDMLALQYNDQSIAENRSLYIAFSELLKPDFDVFRKSVFPVDYRRFRKAVVNLVLTTDIASPERTQVGKSRWKEAFGEPYETVERKIRKRFERRQSSTGANPAGNAAGQRTNRRMSTHSIMSELTLESPGRSMHGGVDDDESVTDTPESSHHGDDGDDDDDGVPKKGKKVRLPHPPPPLPLEARSVPTDAATTGLGTPLFRPAIQTDEGGLSDYIVKTTEYESRQRLRGRRDSAGTPDNRQAPARTRSMDAASVTSTGSRSGANDNNNMAMKFHRRLSNVGSGKPSTRYRNQRLGLLRTVDLSGKTIETYSQRAHPRASATGAVTNNTSDESGDVDLEVVDELRETVVMETILKAADVAHNMQSWENMHKYSDRLFLELRRAYVQGRGENPQDGWFSNQIGFLEAYLLPLARRLDDIGIFGETLGAEFSRNVEMNRDRWMREGMHVTAKVIMNAEKVYPGDDDTCD